MLELPSPEDDGLYIPEVGEWSTAKHHFVSRYMDAFTNAMKGKRWNGLYYIDLFAGAGIERIRGTQSLEWGSPLLAAQIRYPFTGLCLCERDKRKHDALLKRVGRFPNVQLLPAGDANKCIHKVIQQIPERSLSLAFLDPYGLHLEYDTIAVLAQRRVDLIIFFPDYLDALRNLDEYYRSDPDSNLDRCLGDGADWRTILDEVPHDKRAMKLRQLYEAQLRKLGYSEFDLERISIGKHPAYLLIFCSCHPAGAKIWRGISLRKPDGQGTFDFGG
jgi:three-Cys-motif partner protein